MGHLVEMRSLAIARSSSSSLVVLSWLRERRVEALEGSVDEGNQVEAAARGGAPSPPE